MWYEYLDACQQPAVNIITVNFLNCVYTLNCGCKHLHKMMSHLPTHHFVAYTYTKTMYLNDKAFKIVLVLLGSV